MISSFKTSASQRAPKWLLGTLLLLYVLFGLALYQDYGISSDEVIERDNGIVTMRYIGERFRVGKILHDPVIQNNLFMPKLEVYKDRDYPIIFNLSALALERILKIDVENTRQIYFLRHLLTFLTSLVGIMAVYQLANRRFSDWRIGLLSAAFLVLSPRFFAESFFNSKDIIFMSFYALATYTAISFILKPTWKNAIFHGFATALAIDIRIMAVVIPAMTVLLVAIQIARKELAWRRASLLALFYCACATALTLVLWPWLWDDPWARFGEAFQKMSQFSRGPKDLLYWGEVIKTTGLPWHYIPTWIVITTPLIYLILFFVGCLATIKTLLKRHWHLWRGEQELQDLIFLGLLVVPILAVIILHSTLYDGWRQMYFVYPAFLLISIKGWVLLNSHHYTEPLFERWVRPILAVILCISLAWTAAWMVRAHPLQNVYFNVLAGKNWKSTFEVDYWGLSNRMALEYILSENNPAYIKVWTLSYPKLNVAARILSRADQVRIIELDKKEDQPDYIVNTYRMDTHDYVADGQYELVKDFQIGNQTIFSVFRSREVPKPEVQLGKKIQFTPEGQGRAFIGLPGWSFIEPWGIWSDGKEGSLVFPLTSDLQHRPLRVSLMLRAFVTPSHPLQKVEIWVNGNLLQTESLSQSDAKMVRILVPATVNMQKDLTLNLKYLNSMSPRELGVGNDTRRLAIGIESATIE